MIEHYAPLLSLILIRRRAHFLSFLISLIYSWLNNKLPLAIINNSISLLLSMSTIFKNNHFLNKLIFVLQNVYF